MTRQEFETAAREQNEARSREVEAARAAQSPCATIPMLAFGGILYCTTHRVMGECPFAEGGAR